MKYVYIIEEYFYLTKPMDKCLPTFLTLCSQNMYLSIINMHTAVNGDNFLNSNKVSNYYGLYFERQRVHINNVLLKSTGCQASLVEI